jgi:hypothetical protein
VDGIRLRWHSRDENPLLVRMPALDSRRFPNKFLTLRVLPYCAPAVLTTIATLQFVLAHSFGLSPWKGGGFGMFSTVDSPSARFLRIYLVTGDQEIAVMLPSQLNAEARAVRTMPLPHALQDLANSVAAGQWVPYRLRSPVSYYRRLSSITRGPPGARYSDNLPGEIPTPRDELDLGYLNILRMLTRDEPAAFPREGVPFDSVRAELWRYSFDQRASTLKATKYMEVTVPALPSGASLR